MKDTGIFWVREKHTLSLTKWTKLNHDCDLYRGTQSLIKKPKNHTRTTTHTHIPVANVGDLVPPPPLKSLLQTSDITIRSGNMKGVHDLKDNPRAV